jgi:ELWxxDGT repeat protein
VLVSDILAGTASSRPGSVLAAAGGVYFSALNAAGQRTLWFSDGTDSGTRQVHTSSTLTLADGNTPMAGFNGTVYFSGTNALNGYELWRSDGTDSGTFMVLNADADAAPSSNPLNLTPAGDWLYFNAWDGVDANTPAPLWRSDGTPEGTVKLTGITSSSFLPYGRSLFFTSGGKWWMTDGTPEGTVPAATLAGRFPAGSAIDGITGDTFYARDSQGSIYAASLSSSEAALRLGIASGAFFNYAASHSTLATTPSTGPTERRTGRGLPSAAAVLPRSSSPASSTSSPTTTYGRPTEPRTVRCSSRR